MPAISTRTNTTDTSTTTRMAYPSHHCQPTHCSHSAACTHREDLQQPLEAFLPKLSGTMFQKDLGSLLDKAGRVEGLVRPLAAATGLEAAADVAVAAAHLAKADLATSTVMEMTALAGTMGRHYALKQGLAPEVRGRAAATAAVNADVPPAAAPPPPGG